MAHAGILIEITNPSELLDKATTAGVGGIASMVLPVDAVVAEFAAQKIEEQLPDQGVKAKVSVISVPDDAGQSSAWLPYVIVGLLGVAVGAVVVIAFK